MLSIDICSIVSREDKLDGRSVGAISTTIRTEKLQINLKVVFEDSPCFLFSTWSNCNALFFAENFISSI